MHGMVKYEPVTVDGADTVAKLFRQRVAQNGKKVAHREKDLGIWRSYTWEDYGQHAKDIGMGLVSLGLEPGQVVSIISENNKEWLYTDMGVLCAGGVCSGVYTTDSAKQLSYLCNDSETKFLFVENEEQLDKYLEMKDSLSGIVKVIVYDMEGLRDFKDDKVISLDELYDRGRIYAEKNPSVWDERIDNTRPEGLAILIYTSGTTGPPKGAMISNANLIFQSGNIQDYLEVDHNEEQLSFLPLCHIAERLFGVYYPLRFSTTVNFVEGPDTVFENLQEVSPTVFLAVPRIWEKFYSSISIRVKEATLLGRLAYKLALGIGLKAAKYKSAGKSVPPHLALPLKLADMLVLHNIRTLLGLDKIKWAVTGTAPISPDLINWYWALGVELYEVYGQTENVGTATSNRPGENKIGSIGKAAPNTEVKLSDQNEILLKGPHIFMGYLNKPEKTAETIIDGWLHTGDVGEIDENGFVRITDRMKDIIITAGGKNITPSQWENQLKFSPYVSDAVVIGDKKKFLTCLVMIDQENVEKFAQENDVPFTNYASLCKAEEVVKLIGEEVERVNKDFARVETIKRYRLIDQLLTAEDDELTPTMKLKRSFVNTKYKDLIDAMYAEG